MFNRLRKQEDLAVVEGVEIHVPPEDKREMLHESFTIKRPENLFDAFVTLAAALSFFVTHKTHRWWAIPALGTFTDHVFGANIRDFVWAIIKQKLKLK